MKEAKNWLALPEPLKHVSIMVELMDTLKDISDRSENYAQYLSAQDAMRVKLTEEELRQDAEEKLVQKDEEISK